MRSLSRNEPRAEAPSKLRLLVASLAGLAFFSGAMIAATDASVHYPLSSTQIQAALLNNEPLTLPEKDWRTIEAHLSAKPLDSQPLTLLFVQAISAGSKARHDSDELAEMLRTFGRRNSAAQVALIIDSAKNDELASVMEQLDALLRRGKHPDLAFSFLYQVERLPIGRVELVNAFARKPSWAAAYLSQPQALADEQGRDARVELLANLRQRDLANSREFVATSIKALEAAGRYDDAFEIWSSLEPEAARSALGDPEFQTLQQFSPDRRYLLTGFDWQLHSGTGYYSTVSTKPSMPILRIDWDGRGVPLFVSQVLRRVNGRRITLEIGSQNPPTRVAGALAVNARCPAGRDIRFEVVPSEDASNSVKYRSEDPMPCAYPQLRLSGRLRDTNFATELALNSIVSEISSAPNAPQASHISRR